MKFTGVQAEATGTDRVPQAQGTWRADMHRHRHVQLWMESQESSSRKKKPAMAQKPNFCDVTRTGHTSLTTKGT